MLESCEISCLEFPGCLASAGSHQLQTGAREEDLEAVVACSWVADEATTYSSVAQEFLLQFIHHLVSNLVN